LFGEVVDGVMRLNAFGEIVRDESFRTAVVRPYVMLDPDEFVVMPNHVHGIIWIVRSGDGDHGDDGGGVFAGAHGGDALVGAQRRCAPTDTDTNANAITDAVNITKHRQCRGATPTNVIPGSLGAIVRAIKSATTKRINALRGTPAAPAWGRNYYEHIIRYETSLVRIRRCIAANPSRWAEDRDHPRHPLRRRANAPGAGV
jgi:REP element-mobilizing transposase RayT